MPRVVHFEISADDPARAVAFYQNVFGWEVNQWEGQDYWLLTTGAADTPGIDGALMRRREGAPNVVNTIDVADLDASLAAVDANGGRMMDRMVVPGVGYLAYCWDSEGNFFGMMQRDLDAKM